MEKIMLRRGGLVSIIIVFCLLIVFLIWNRIFCHIEEDRKETLTAAIQRNSNLVGALEQYAIRTLRNADALLNLAKVEYKRTGDKIDLRTLLEQGVIDPNCLNGVVILDETGKLQYSNLELDKRFPFVLADREYFQVHRNQKDLFFVSTPLWSRVNKKASVVISRRIDKSDGSFGGIVAVQVDPSKFTEFYANSDLRTHDIISLISSKGITYSRRTGERESYGEDISSSPLFEHVKKSPHGYYHANDAIRGIPTYFCYRKLADYPMIATVGSAEADVFAGFHERAQREYLFGAAITILIISFLIFLNIVTKERKRNLKRIRESEFRYRSIFENSQDAIVVAFVSGEVERMNRAAVELFKIKDDERESLSLERLFGATDADLNLDVADDSALKKELILTRDDGTEFTCEMVYSTYKDTNGRVHLIILVRDISLRKQMEQQLLQTQKRYQRMLTRQIILAQEREREAISHELHDNVNQILTTVKLYLEMAVQQPNTREDVLPRSIEYVMSCITEIRNLSRRLAAPTLGNRSLVESIRELLEMVETSSRVTINFSHEEYRIDLNRDQKIAIYRILQEQLNNIIKHAGANEVTIHLAQTNELTELTVLDNGKGFDLAARRTGIGLNNIQNRAKVFGGDTTIESKPGRGCVLKVRLPIMAEETDTEVILRPIP